MTREATIRSSIPNAAVIAAAVTPDNTEAMQTQVEDDEIATTIERGSTSGLRSTADDYVRNLTVAIEVAETANRHAGTTEHESNT
ncbi:MAG: KEOPS complex subunit Pcc1 [Halodesulfurarchaeum sp.]